MHIIPEAHRDEYHHGRAPAGRSVVGPRFSVEADPEGAPVVWLRLDPLPTETLEDQDVDRTLTAAEAREVAAMLWHHADEADRRNGLR